MSSNIAGTDTFPATFAIPSGGDARNAASVNAALEALANRTTYLKSRVGAQRVVDSDYEERTTAAFILDSNLTTYGVIGDGTVDGIATLSVAAGDIVEYSGFVHVVADVGPTDIYLQPQIKCSLSGGGNAFVEGAEIIDVQNTLRRVVPISARLIVPTDAIDAYCLLRLKSGFAGSAVQLWAPSLIVVRAWRAN